MEPHEVEAIRGRAGPSGRLRDPPVIPRRVSRFGEYRGNPRRYWSRRRDLNSRPADYESAALPLSYIGACHETRPGPGAFEGRESYHDAQSTAVCSAAKLMTPEQARDLRNQLDAASKDVSALTSGMNAAALGKRPTAGGWSVAEALQHLVLTAAAMEPLAEKAIAELERDGRKATGPSGLGFVGWLLVKALEPPPRMKSKTSAPFVPLTIDDPLSLTEKLLDAHQRLDALIERAAGLATDRVRIVSPFNASAKYNLYAAFRILLAHTRRHLWQAREAKPEA